MISQAAACKEVWPYANKEVRIPVSTSPLPAVTMPALPVKLNQILPVSPLQKQTSFTKGVILNEIFVF